MLRGLTIGGEPGPQAAGALGFTTGEPSRIAHPVVKPSHRVKPSSNPNWRSCSETESPGLGFITGELRSKMCIICEIWSNLALAGVWKFARYKKQNVLTRFHYRRVKSRFVTKLKNYESFDNFDKSGFCSPVVKPSDPGPGTRFHYRRAKADFYSVLPMAR